MKTKLLLVIFVIIIAGMSCSVTKYTHAQVMDAEFLNQSKYGILSKFGNPTVTKEIDSNDVWIYNMAGKTGTSGKFSALTSKNIPPYQASDNSNQYGSSISGTYPQFIMITFHNGRVTKWASQGVNLAEKQSMGGSGNGLKTFLGIYLVVMALALTVLIPATSNPY